MADSDEDYVQDISDDDVEAHQVTRGAGAGAGTRASGAGVKGGGWEVTRTWEEVVESSDGTINSTIEGLLEAVKRKRLLRDTTPVQRGIIRHVILIVDLSIAMAEIDFRPTRYLLTLRYVSEFVTEFFEQNPISQLGIIGMRDGLAVRVSDMGGNPSEHITNLQTLREQEPKGNPSLENAFDMARGALFHAPAHGTREIILIFGSLLSSDPGDIHSSISALCAAHITCTVIGLAAQIAICQTLVARTNPNLPLAKCYAVALNEGHYRDLLMPLTTPPATPSAGAAASEEAAIKSSLLMMGFPSRIVDSTPTLCACHSRPTRGGYDCSRCGTRVCSLPTSCPACGLTLILSTHLARSYHHLFPLQNWGEVSWHRAAASDQKTCFGCQSAFPEKPTALGPDIREGMSSLGAGRRKMALGGTVGKHAKPRANPRYTAAVTGSASKDGVKDGVSESGRYECGNCGRFFCIDCDVFCHEVVHNCPGCQSREGVLAAAAHASNGDGLGNGNGVGGGPVEGGGEGMENGRKVDVDMDMEIG